MKSWPGCRPKCPLSRSITPPDEGPLVKCGFTLSHAEETGGIIIPLVRFYMFFSQNSYSLGQSLCAKPLGLLISVSLPRKPLCFFFSPGSFACWSERKYSFPGALGSFTQSLELAQTQTHVPFNLQPNSHCGWPPSLLNIKDIPPTPPLLHSSLLGIC